MCSSDLIYPTPQDNQPSTVRIAYRAKWVEMDELDDVANITFKAESLLIRITRALANFYQTGDRKLLDAIPQSNEYAMLRQEDGFSQPRLGALAGGAAYQNVIVPWLPFNYVGGPTNT